MYMNRYKCIFMCYYDDFYDFYDFYYCDCGVLLGVYCAGRVPFMALESGIVECVQESCSQLTVILIAGIIHEPTPAMVKGVRYVRLLHCRSIADC